MDAFVSAGAGGGGRPLLEQALDHGIGSVQDPSPELVALMDYLDRSPSRLDLGQWEEGRRKWINASMSGHLAMTINPADRGHVLGARPDGRLWARPAAPAPDR